MITIDKDFAWVVLVIGLSHFMNFYLTYLVVKARKQYGVEYPTLYLPPEHKDAFNYNSAQRAHQNTLEMWSSVQVMMIITGLAYPIVSAVLGAVWVLGRFIYGFSYSSGGPEKRMIGGFVSHLGDFPLIILCFITVWKLYTS